MKNIVCLLMILFAMTLFFQSCKKESPTEPTIQTITQSLKANQSYQFDLGTFCDEEGANSSKQANYFSISSIDRDINTGKGINKYIPATNFLGKDVVEIKSARGSNGTSAYNKIVYTTIKFTITN